jgi:predicted Zn-dependent protease
MAEIQNPLEPAKYDVFLEPVAVSSLMDWLSMIGFGAKGVIEKTSFLAGKIGKKVMSPELTIYDDGNDISGLAMPFDFEGVPKKKVDIIKKGIACGQYRFALCGKAKTRSTGHAMIPGYFRGADGR